MSTRVCVATGSRAEYHLLTPLLRRLSCNPEFDLRIAVTGAHLSPEQGNTYREIEDDGFSIDQKIPILDEDDSPSGKNRAIARAIEGFDRYFSQSAPGLLVILGDRYEMLGVATAAMMRRIPIAHIHGGETTEGAADEAVRHSITKMSQLHFTSCERYRHRVIQLGEDPDRVFNVGSLGVENIANVSLMTRPELEQSLGINFGDRVALVTYHPVTLDERLPGAQAADLIEALSDFPGMTVLFTKANADAGGAAINSAIERACADRPAWHLFASLGMRRYLSALSLVDVVVGNSSSGILEAPSFGVPVVNIGDRQRGRVQSANIINCEDNVEAMRDAIAHALTDSFREEARAASSPYGDGHASELIVEQIERWCARGIDVKKHFYDLG